MKKLLLILLCLPMIGFGQYRYNINEVAEIQNVRSGQYRYHLKGSLEPVTGIVYKSFDNGQLQIESECKDGWLNGTSRVWHKNGQLHTIEIYENEKLVSSACWNEDGAKVFCNLQGSIFKNITISTFFIIGFIFILFVIWIIVKNRLKNKTK